MVTDYELQNLINTMGGYMATTQDLHKTLVFNTWINNCTEEQKKQIHDAYVNGLIKKLSGGDVFYNSDLLKNMLDSNLISEVLINKKDEIKDIVFKKIIDIFSKLERNDARYSSNNDKFDYESLLNSFKDEINDYIKKSIKDILKGENKSIFELALKNITKALTKTSISSYADTLFKKAQTIINEEIIKDIIE